MLDQRQRAARVAADLVEAGVTDCRISVPLPDDGAAAEETLVELVDAFRAAAGRTSRYDQ